MMDGVENDSYSEINRYLEFSLGDENYAIPLLRVREVIAVPSTTPIPQTPSHFVGMMNLRGQVISIVDLRKKLGIKSENVEDSEAVIILDLDPVFVGVVVDSVNKVLAISNDKISDSPNTENKKANDYIWGIYRGENTMTVLMDIAKVMDVKDYQIINKNAA